MNRRKSEESSAKCYQVDTLDAMLQSTPGQNHLIVVARDFKTLASLIQTYYRHICQPLLV
jgi:hypothetical protein